jgi:hypothetical protein
MSRAEQNLQTWLYLLENELVRIPDRDSLLEQIEAAADTPEQLSDALILWCREHPEVRQQLKQTRKQLFGDSDAEKAPGSQKGKVPPVDAELSKQNISNAIRNSHSQKSPPSQGQS